MRNANLVSVRIITADIKRLVHFFEQATGATAVWATEDFAELKSDAFTLAIGSSRTMAFFSEGVATPEANKSVIIEFLVDNVDEDYERIKALTTEIDQQPTTMPWGNRSLLFRDPDGNLINFFTPVSDEAKKRFAI
ncbi:VOC family protein [Pedobacter faecalis]|uniref:VOC family protein n=1 Tax=Pedobacter faecalis TaxID=3041495 RepID=UPI00254B6D2E|nr:VOC family protein [Pedobacter sp. ELA7]